MAPLVRSGLLREPANRYWARGAATTRAAPSCDSAGRGEFWKLQSQFTTDTPLLKVLAASTDSAAAASPEGVPGQVWSPLVGPETPRLPARDR